MDLDKTLWLAIKSNKDQLVFDLLQKGADVEYIGDNFLQEKPIHLATTMGSASIMKILLQFKANVDTVTRFKKTSLHMSCEKGNFEIVKLLLENGADPEAKQYGNLKTPLHISCEIGSIELVQLLINNYGVNIDPETAASRFFDLDKTPLHYACRRGFIHIVKLLVSKGANVFSLSHDNFSSMQIAENQGHSNISSLLLTVINKENSREEYITQNFQQLSFQNNPEEGKMKMSELELKLEKSENQIISLQQKLWESFKIISQINNPHIQQQNVNIPSDPSNNPMNSPKTIHSPQLGHMGNNINNINNSSNENVVLSNEQLTNPFILKLNEELLRVSKFAEQHSKVNQVLHMRLYEQQVLCRSAINDFKILQQISSNDEYNVYRVKSLKLGREYTFKVLKDISRTDNSFLRFKFYNELKSYSSLSPHANILTLFSNSFSNFSNLLSQQSDTENQPQQKIFEVRLEKPNILSHYIVMEREHISLKEYLKNWKREKQILMKMMCDLTAGIAHLYKNGIAHTAIKLENINVKVESGVFTFQLANMEYSVNAPEFTIPFDPLFHQAQIEENLINLPPEILFAIQNKQNVNYEKCDVFSFGCLIYEVMLGSNIFEKIDKRDYHPPSVLSNVTPFCTNLNKFLMNTVDPNPNSRYGPKKLLEILSSVVNINHHNFTKN